MDMKMIPAMQKISETIGKNKVLAESFPDEYLTDRTSGACGKADFAVVPSSVEDVSAVLRICSEYGIPVTVRGAGTGVTGGAVPGGGVILSMERFNKIIEIDSDNLAAVVEPCVITSALNNAAQKCGLMYPVDPGSQDESSIGGNVAESAGGMSAVKYGTTKDYLIGAEFVTADGHIMNAGGRFVKNAAGLNILALLAGSEGTLAVITKLIMRLVPLPGVRRDILIAFESLENAADAVKAITIAHITPTAVEFMERDAIALVARHGGKNIPLSDAAVLLLIRIDAGSDAELDRQEKEILSAAVTRNEKHLTARDEKESALLWSVRRGIRPAIEEESPVFLAEDCAVPRAEIPRFVKEIKRAIAGLKMDSIIFGHAGDGNVHIDVLRRGVSDSDWKDLLKKLKPVIYRIALDCGGTITGEHGIGNLRKEYMPMQFTQEELDLMKRVKRAFDPQGILNPGKMF